MQGGQIRIGMKAIQKKLLAQGCCGSPTTADPSTRFIEVLGRSCESDSDGRTGALGSDTVAIVSGKQPLQIAVALRSRAFSRVHHSVLVGRGSGVTSFSASIAAAF
jgi:hypothetical protein